MSRVRLLLGDDASLLGAPNFQLLLLANLLVPLGGPMLSAVLDSLIDPFGASAATIGLMMSMFTAPAIVMIPVAGVLADRYGRKPVLVPSVFLFGAAGAAIGLTTDFRIALGLRLLQGVAFGGINPIIITSIGDLYTDSTEAAAQGLRLMVVGVFATVISLSSGLLVVAAWQYPFALYTIAFPIGIVVWLFLDEPTAAETTPVTDGGTDDTTIRALWRLVRQRRAWAFLLARWLPPVAFIAFITYNSIIVVRLLNGTPAQAGVLAGIQGLFFAGGGSQAGRLTAAFETRRTPLLGANVAILVGLVAVLFAPALPVAIGGIAINSLGLGITLSLYRSIMTDLAPGSLRGGLVSLAEAGGRLTATLTPIAMGAGIAVLTPVVGFNLALRLVGVGAAVVAGGGGIVFVLIGSTAPHITHDPEPAE
ncbi:MAG: MFS transporter [Halobacteriales archaeon]|nr:MFS transporter [Halobacteriales archaeon]